MTSQLPAQILFLFLLLALSTAGCSLTQHKNKVTERKERIAKKQENYSNLHQELSNQTIKIGTGTEAVKKLFGEPDDVFRSSSSVSNFEIWTYEKLLKDGDKDNWNPIRLYFDNGQLVNWKY